MLATVPAAIAAAAETADEFVARLNKEFADIALEYNAAGWTQATYITVDTQLLSARANERYLGAFSKAVADAEEVRRPADEPGVEANDRVAEARRRGPGARRPGQASPNSPRCSPGMEAKYGEAKYCKPGGKECRDEVQLKAVLEKSRDYDELLDAWKGWHDQARGLRADYARYVELANEGARELGYQDLGAMWRSNYDMPADEFTREAARLYAQVEPFYKDLQCYARTKLAQEVRRGQGAGGQADPGAPARQHVGAAVGRGVRPARAVSRREPARRRFRARSRRATTRFA